MGNNSDIPDVFCGKYTVCGRRESSNEISRGMWRPDCRQRLPERPTSQHNLKAEIKAKRP